MAEAAIWAFQVQSVPDGVTRLAATTGPSRISTFVGDDVGPPYSGPLPTAVGMLYLLRSASRQKNGRKQHNCKTLHLQDTSVALIIHHSEERIAKKLNHNQPLNIMKKAFLNYKS